MSVNTLVRAVIWLSAMLVLFAAQPAQAYIGPGVGLGAVAVVLALVFGFGLLIIGLVWFPLKRAFKRTRKDASEKSQTARPE